MYVLPESLTLRNARLIGDELITLYKHKSKVTGQARETTLDFSHLQDLDTAGLQLLLSTAKTFRKSDCPLKVINLQSPLEELLKLSGAGDIL
ncbi:MAG TPA: STAS domain-containing protein [Firmicutes bacterium]|jgi:anti-anti-sigma regulatory factor|nr:STAS domain-containing protein [Bacillota bacterium]